MTSRAPTIRMTDIKRAIAAVKATGLPVSQVVIDLSAGKIAFSIDEQDRELMSPFDKWKASREP